MFLRAAQSALPCFAGSPLGHYLQAFFCGSWRFCRLTHTPRPATAPTRLRPNQGAVPGRREQPSRVGACGLAEPRWPHLVASSFLYPYLSLLPNPLRETEISSADRRGVVSALSQRGNKLPQTTVPAAGSPFLLVFVLLGSGPEVPTWLLTCLSPQWVAALPPQARIHPGAPVRGCCPAQRGSGQPGCHQAACSFLEGESEAAAALGLGQGLAGMESRGLGWAGRGWATCSPSFPGAALWTVGLCSCWPGLSHPSFLFPGPLPPPASGILLGHAWPRRPAWPPSTPGRWGWRIWWRMLFPGGKSGCLLWGSGP